MKKYIIIALVSLIVGGTSVLAAKKLNMVWEYFPDQSFEASFSSPEQIKVFKFTDDLGKNGTVNCYVSVSRANYLKDRVNTEPTLNSSISCVK